MSVTDVCHMWSQLFVLPSQHPCIECVNGSLYKHHNLFRARPAKESNFRRYDNTSDRLTDAVLHPSRSLAWYGLCSQTVAYAYNLVAGQERGTACRHQVEGRRGTQTDRTDEF